MDGDSGSRTSPTLLGRLCQPTTDEAAWSVFVARYGPRIMDWCRHRGLQEADAEDVKQDLLQALLQKLRVFVYDPGRSFRGWLRTLTEHALSDFSRSRRTVLSGGDSQVEALLESVEARTDLLARFDFDQELLEEAQARVQLRVDPPTWEAFRLTVLDGLPGAVAAGQLGLRLATVYKACSRVRKMLQEEVHKLEHPGPD